MLHVVVEVSFVLHLLVVSLSDFSDFIVVNVELLSLDVEVMEVLLGLKCAFWGFEADESVEGLSFFGQNFDALDLSVLLEEVFQFLVGKVSRNILDVEVASFLGQLVPQHFLLLLHFPFSLRDCFFNVELVRLSSELVFLVLLSFDGSFNTFESILNISISSSIANEAGWEFDFFGHLEERAHDFSVL